MDDRRRGKLHFLFKQVLEGKNDVLTIAKARRFIEALCAEDDRVACVQSIISSPDGISALQQSIRIDITPTYMNTTVTQLLQYLQHPELVAACNGDLLHTVLRHLVDPPVFWTSLVIHVEAQALDPPALLSFAWLLSRLLSIPEIEQLPFIKVASSSSIKHVLENAYEPEVRNLHQKIQSIVQILTTIVPIVVDGPGGRHDNDFTDFRKIAILPSIDELISSDAPYLRFATEIDQVEAPQRLAAQLDNQFRLLREDMLYELKEELAGQSKRSGLRIGGLKMTNVAYDARNHWAIEFACLSGLSFMPKSKDSDNREAFLKKHRKVLAHGSLVCIFADKTFLGLATVWRRETLLAQQVPLLHLHLSSNAPAVRRILLALRGQPEIEVRQLNTAVFAYEPILKQLQRIRHISLAESLLGWQKDDQIPLARTIDSYGPWLQKLESDPFIELQHILSLRKSVVLDSSQAKSLIASLTQRIALVQGPPGTGKSFIGALAAKALHRFTPSKILVLSYTNHALDQYLEDLLDIGIPANDMVRLGSAAKATTLTKPLALMDQVMKKGFRLTRSDWELIESRQAVSNTMGAQLVSAFREFIRSKAMKKDIMNYLEFSEYSEYFDAFEFVQESDDFKIVDDKGEAASEFYLLDRWFDNKGPSDAVPKTHNDKGIWSMSVSERKKLGRKWLNAILDERLDRITECGAQYDKSIDSILKVKNDGGRRLMQSMRVIGCTTTAAAKYIDDIQSAAPDIIIVEEAGEILESHILAALGQSTTQLILIGDHKQLRPKAHYNLSVEKGVGYDLNRSLFERLVLKGYPHQTLSQQHRMRPEISAIVRSMTYPELSDADSTLNRAAMRGLQKSLVFVAHDSVETEGIAVYDPRDGGATASKTNYFEAEMTLKCVKYLAQQGYRSDQIVVLTPYLGQLRLLHEVLSTQNDPVLNDLDSYDLVKAGLMPQASTNAEKAQLRVSTVDNYQGEESDIVVVSLTRSNKRGDIGFMSSPERLNVLLSRARDGLIIIGNPETFLNARKGQEMWESFLNMLRSSGCIYEGVPVRCERHWHKEAILSSPTDFDSLCPDGGCDSPCGTLLNCGLHACPSKCHQLYDHSKTQCTAIMTDTCPSGSHHMSWQCWAQRPTTCQICYEKQKREEARKRREHEKSVNEAMSSIQHDEKMSKIDAQIEAERQKIIAMSLQDDRDRVHQQKLADLEQAKSNSLRVQHKSQPASASAFESLQKQGGSLHATSPDKSVYSAAGPPPKSQTSPTSTPASSISQSTPAISVSESQPAHSKQDTSSPAEQQWKQAKSLEGKENLALDDLMAMTGLEDVKSKFISILEKLETVKRQGADMKQERLGTVFVGNPGTGKTTVARIFARFLSELGVLPGRLFVETTGAKLAYEGVGEAKSMMKHILQVGGGVIFVDEAYQLVTRNNSGGGAVLDYLLAEIENNTGKVVFVFAGYEKQMEKFFQHNPGLASRMPHTLKFADYTEEELLKMLGHMIDKRFKGRMQIEDGSLGLYMRIVVRRLHRGSGRDGFGNARALENLLDRITSAQSRRLAVERRAGQKPNDFRLTKEDLIGPKPEGALQDSRAWAQLQGLTGLDTVKGAVRLLLDRFKINYARELKEEPIVQVSLNRLFLGSPGTGKTTVAKLYGQVLADLGILSTSECIVKTPSDFIGSHLGESEKKTKAILDNSKGKVLVIDEAYMFWSEASSHDSYREAVIDTIVSEVHSESGDDRAVLLLGYEHKMKEMLLKVNPGLTRRFPVENAFMFEDYNNEQLLSILNSKMNTQGLLATQEAKDVAIELLDKLRRRPNFGNAGEVENLLSRAKDSHLKRHAPGQEADHEIIFEPQDFDADYQRNKNAIESLHTLFRDVVGAEDIVQKLEGLIRSFSTAKEMGCNPMDILPFNFVFKGPPGTGKTTTARKIGRVFYDMGLLASDKVIECSTTDLIGKYVGHTGPKVVGKFEEALGQVLFIDEAYRLGDSHFAKEAADELVDCLTKERYRSKLIVVIAGYEDEINRMLSANPGLSSRFPEEVFFHDLSPRLCLELLVKKIAKLEQLSINLDLQSQTAADAMDRLQTLSHLSGWGNGRDIETLAKRTINFILNSRKPQNGKLEVLWSDLMTQIIQLDQERVNRVSIQPNSLSSRKYEHLPSAVYDPINNTPQPPPSSSNDISHDQKKADPEEHTRSPSATVYDQPYRDAEVTDAVWQQLQLDKAKNAKYEADRDANIESVQKEHDDMLSRAKDMASQETALERQAAVNIEARKRLEALRLKAVEEKRKADEAAAKLKAMTEEKAREQKIQRKLKEMGVCPQGYRWNKQSGGYRCAGGSHWMDDAALNH